VSSTASNQAVGESRDSRDEFAPEIQGPPLKSESSAAKNIQRLAGPVILLVIVTIVYGSIYFREESISTGIGANLVPAERVLKGEAPYRDFYKIQTPGILLLNAGLFNLLGTSLLTALRGVLVFKVITVALVFIIARMIVPARRALIPTLLTMVWLPPGGPFRPAPIQYEMLFILTAIYFLIRWLGSRRAINVFAAGVAVGLVALLKQNVGVYAAVAFALVIILNTRGVPGSIKEATWIYFDSWKTNARAHIAAAIGVGLPLAGLFIYLASNHALQAAARVFIQGPGEHIQMKFTGYPLPKYAAIIVAACAAALLFAEYYGRKSPARKTLIGSVVVFAASVCAVIAPQAAIDNSIYWFAPLLFIYATWQYLKRGDGDTSDLAPGKRERGVVLVLLLFAAASFGEVFPRSVRGLLIGTMPPAFLLFTFLFGWRNPFARLNRRLVFAIATVVMCIFALRLILPDYFQMDSAGIRFKADTELAFDRGRGVYLPNKRATEVIATVEFIQSHVQEGGYFFAHALDATSYYFLAGRNSPTGATLWNDAGTDDAERARTLKTVRDRQVRLVLTSEQALANEGYAPLLDYMNNNFHQASVIGKLIFLERNY
jgi:hypothetical protein